MKYLIHMGAEVNAPPAEESGRTALQAAAESGHEDIVKYLIDNGADINAPMMETAGYDKPGRTAIQAAAENGHEEIVIYLINKGANPSAPPAMYAGRTALQAAAENGYAQIVKYLIDKGADVHAPPAQNYGVTALKAATVRRHISIMILIIDNLTPEHCEEYLFSAFRDGLCSMGESEVAKTILSAGKINVNTQSDSGDTLLHLALRNRWGDIVSLLLEMQASTEIRITENKSPLRLTLEMKDIDMLRILLKYGACTTGIAASTVRSLLGLCEHKLVLLEENEVTRCKTLDTVDDWSNFSTSPGCRAL